MDDIEDVREQFESAADFVNSSVASGSNLLKKDDLLALYGFYKQATVGACNTSKPAFWDFSGVAKWDAWKKHGEMTPEIAMQSYVQLLSRLVPSWSATDSSSSQRKAVGPSGPVFSSLKSEAQPEADMSDLREVAGLGDLAAVERLLQAGADVNAPDDNGCTALHFAADRGHADVARVLISHGASVNCRDSEQQTPLHYAAICENEQVCMVLLEAGADQTLQDEHGATPSQVGPSTWKIWQGHQQP